MSQSPRLEPYDGSLIVRTPYHPGFVDELKAMIPRAERSWVPESKYWLVDECHHDLLAHLISRYFGGYELVDTDTGEVTYVESDGSRSRQERML